MMKRLRLALWLPTLAFCAASAGSEEASASIRWADLTYTSPGNTSRAVFDLYTANAGITTGSPTILDLHGGGYTTGDKGLDQQICGLLADRGFNVVSMNYTLAVPGVSSSFPQTIRDVRAMITWIRTTGVEWGMSPTIVVVGHSAGATIGVAAAYAPSTPEFDPLLPVPPGGYRVDAVVGVSGRYDLVWDAQTFGSPQSVINYLGMPITAPGGPERYAMAAARTYVHGCSPPTKLIVGDQDGVVPMGNTTRLATALSNAGVFTILQIVAGAGHGTQQLQSPLFVASAIASDIPQLLAAGGPTCGLIAPSNDRCEGAMPISPGQIIEATTIGATNDTPPTCGQGDTRDVWFRLTSPALMEYVIDTAGTTGIADTTLTVYDGCQSDRRVLACNDNAGGALGPHALVQVPVEAGQSVLVRVAGNGGASGNFRLRVDHGTVYFPPPLNDRCDTAATAELGTTLGTTLGAMPHAPAPCGVEGERDVWFYFDAPLNGVYRFDLAGTTDLPRCSLQVLAACGGSALACQSNYGLSGTPPLPAAEVPLIGGQRVLVRIGNEPIPGGSFVLTVSRRPSPFGACCNGGICTFIEADACTAGAFFQAQTCEGIPCSPLGDTPGACCVGAACTITAGANDCSGSFMGGGVACGQPGNPIACCPANFNRVGGVTVQDVFDFLAAYFVQSPTADFNNSGAVSVQDIFEFLVAYFAQCS